MNRSHVATKYEAEQSGSGELRIHTIELAKCVVVREPEKCKR